MYESIVKGEHTHRGRVCPSSFNVLIKELQALCLNIELVDVNAETGVGTNTVRDQMSAAECERSVDPSRSQGVTP